MRPSSARIRLQDDEARAGRLVDPDAQANERLSANLPYLFPVCRFAHYLKAIARDKIGTFKERADMQVWLSRMDQPLRSGQHGDGR